ncbi:MAG: glycosyltransferase family 4 protein [Limimaricola soesokkakensis]|uniref:glycosyltransferase family 4 protein n=1 Tax=Limimaricola soesokkakensis TaxID=1343159 RepID=UPI00405A345D
MEFPDRDRKLERMSLEREAPKSFPELTPDLTAALLNAACVLGAADRPISRRVLLGAVASQASGLFNLKKGFRKAIDASLADLARECLTAVEQAMPLSAQDGWIRQAHLELGNITPFSANLLKQRLSKFPKKLPPRSSGAICYMLHMSLPHNTTGYSMRTQEFVKEMVAAGQQVYCMTRPGFPADVGQEQFASRDTIDGVTYHRIAEPSRVHVSQTSYVDRAANVLAEKFKALRPAVVMAASNYETAAPALIAARQLGIPFVYEMRGFWELTKLSVNPAYEEDPQFHRSFDLEAEIAKHSDQVFTLTQGMAGELRRRGVVDTRIDILPNAADPQRFQPRKRDADFARRLNLHDRTPVIGYIGSFNQYEGLDDLVRACGILHRRKRDFRLLLVGDEARHLKGKIIPELRNLVSREELEEKTTMTGRVPASEVESWYSLVDISPIPRKSMPVTQLVSPLKPFEAMAMEKAVLLPDLPSMLEIALAGETGSFYQNGSWAALAEALDELLVNSEKRRSLGRAARHWIVKERNWESVARHCIARLTDDERPGGPLLGSLRS